MSNVTKTILILQLDSWTTAHSGASCRFLSTSCLPFFHFHCWNTHPHRSVHFEFWCVFIPTNASLDHWVLKWPPPADRVQLVRLVLLCTDCSSSLSPDVSVLCPAVQTVSSETYSLRHPACLHFIQTLAWSHSNQKDPASLCRAGKRRHTRWLIWIFGGGVSVTACRELPGSKWHPGVCEDDKCSVGQPQQGNKPLAIVQLTSFSKSAFLTSN